MLQKILVGVIVVLGIAIGVWFVTRKTKQIVAPVLSVQAYNQTKNTSAANTTATASDVIIYTLTAENQTDQVIEGYIMQANLKDMADKVTLLDTSGAQYDSAINSLVWMQQDIPAHNSLTKTFGVKVNPLPTGTTSAALKIIFNNELNIPIISAGVAGVNTGSSVVNSSPIYQAPITGPNDALPQILALVSTLTALAVTKYRKIKLLASNS